MRATGMDTATSAWPWSPRDQLLIESAEDWHRGHGRRVTAGRRRVDRRSRTTAGARPAAWLAASRAPPGQARPAALVPGHVAARPRPRRRGPDGLGLDGAAEQDRGIPVPHRQLAAGVLQPAVHRGPPTGHALGGRRHFRTRSRRAQTEAGLSACGQRRAHLGRRDRLVAPRPAPEPGRRAGRGRPARRPGEHVELPFRECGGGDRVGHDRRALADATVAAGRLRARRARLDRPDLRRRELPAGRGGRGGTGLGHRGRTGPAGRRASVAARTRRHAGGPGGGRRAGDRAREAATRAEGPRRLPRPRRRWHARAHHLPEPRAKTGRRLGRAGSQLRIP